MIPFPLILLLLLLYLISTVLAVSGGEGTYANAAIEGAQIIDNSTHIPTGFYSFRHVETNKYLQFIDFQNQIVPTEGKNSTVFNGTLWTVKWHGDKNYSIHHLNHARYDKCLSTRWDHTRGNDDAGVAWQCEVDNKTIDEPDFDIYPGFHGVYNASLPRPLHGGKEHNNKRLDRRYVNTYEAIRQDKQQWLFMRDDPSKTFDWTNVAFDPATGKNKYNGDIIQPDRKKNQHSGSHLVYLVSAAHLWNMRSRCLHPTASYVFDFTPNNTGVTNLDFCHFGNQSLLWEMTLWKPKDFVLGEEPNPDFVHPVVSVWSILGASYPGETILLWSCLLLFSLVAWIWHSS
ncbi:uncharacterized protein BX664DRAFT_326624 [Halteromyces radiatus]|uniref:uncharacterized protein n=1 Tax=Halteromyces radiatus TaxID=101107 RepID=UPI00221F75BB|nr:uncharacterized protein BX664DRAFT_326624 [Halteromyces radiatus]KAI8097532.1 hypothetical protein BX664DRAFT_326624 [Halteromyces radiatus]